MGMISDGDAFAAMIQRGEMVQVGTDRFGLPTYSHRNAFAKPFAWATPQLSQALHAIVRQSITPRT